ncbi:MAG: TonB-dependent receptor [Verrucomicrobiota bacterium]
MKPPSTYLRQLALLVFLIAGAIHGPAAFAQAPAAGTVSGRIINPATGEYVRNAVVSVEGTAISTVSEDGGRYVLNRVPAGEVRVLVTFTGYRPARAMVLVNVGGTTERDFELSSSLSAAADGGSVVKLQEFVVSGAREGSAKAIMEQRNSMNITNSVGSEEFGDVAEGNVAEFLKNIPGVDIEMANSEARYARLRGLGAHYTQLTLDGVSLASADANAAGTANARAFSFEQVSLSSMDSIEVSKTISADVDASAPAGTINLKTKRAFDRQGRRTMVQLNFTAHSQDFEIGKRELVPNGELRRSILPGGILEFSDVFFNKRLGIVLNLSQSNTYLPTSSTVNTYNYTTTPTDQRPVVLSSISTTANIKTGLSRSTVTFTSDYKVTPRLVASFTYIYNTLANFSMAPQVTFATGARTNVLGADPSVSFTTTGAASTVTLANSGVSKNGDTSSYIPKLEYKNGSLTVDARFAASISKNDYLPLTEEGIFYQVPLNALSGVNFKAERSSPNTADWKITQLSGPDWSDLSNYKNPRARHDTRHAKTELYSGELNATFQTRTWLPITWKGGIKSKEDNRESSNTRDYYQWAYVGPGGGSTGSWGAYPSAFPFNLNNGLSIASTTGRNIVFPDQKGIASTFKDHPEYFTIASSATNYYTAFVANEKEYVETINSSYLMGTTRIKALRFRAGLRYEDTATESTEYNPRPGSEVVAAGFPISGGRATTAPGIDYQFRSRPKITRDGGYDNFFPSASAKYDITEGLSLNVGYSRTIQRPTFDDVTGLWTVNEDTQTVNAPNPNLTPEMSHNLSARLAYYFEPVGMFGLGVFENRIKGLRTTNRFTAEEFGYGNDPQYAGYTFVSGVSSSEEIYLRGLELEYSQSLSILPGPFKGLNVRAAYTRTYRGNAISGITPHTVTGGLYYSIGRVRLNASGIWKDTTPANAAGTNLDRHRLVVDAGGSFFFTNNVSFFFMARNLLNEPVLGLEKIGANPALVRQYAVHGTALTFGVKGTF